MQVDFMLNMDPKSKTGQRRLLRAQNGAIPEERHESTPRSYMGTNIKKSKMEVVTQSKIGEKGEGLGVADDDARTFLSEDAPLFGFGTPIPAFFAIEKTKHA